MDENGKPLSPEEDPLFQQLAAEEPPLDNDDTSPSATTPRPAVRSGGGLWLQYMGGLILLAALILTVAAGLVIFAGDDEEPESAGGADTTTVSDKPTSIVPTDEAPASAPTVVVAEPDNFLPTAAVDEASIALLTPVPAATDSGAAVQRVHIPFTRQSGGGDQAFARYVVQQGDTLEAIKSTFNLNDLCTIVWSNDRSKVSPLRPGSELLIPPEDGVFFKIRESMTIAELAETTGVDPMDIIDSPYNPYLEGATPNNILLEGVQIMVVDGDGGNCNIWSGKPTVSGDEDGGDVTETIRYYSLWGCETTISGGGFPVQTPINNYQFFQGFSAYHTGVDLSGSIGEPLYAAGLGTVIFAGWNQYGYGYTVVIAHGTRFTLYGHMETYDVACGQNVSQGQYIGTVGNTGNSTGPHVHFEIRDANFDPMDPCYTIRC